MKLCARLTALVT